MQKKIKLDIPKFSAIPQFTQRCSWHVDVSLSYLTRFVEEHIKDFGLNTNPNFQREHVWTKDQQISFVEYCLRGGETAKQIYCNCPGWEFGKTKDYVLVDGKQRLTAALSFLNNEIPVFDYYFKDFQDKLRLHNPSFSWNINNLTTRAEVLRWYLEINFTGTPHSQDEIEKIENLLEKEKSQV